MTPDLFFKEVSRQLLSVPDRTSTIYGMGIQHFLDKKEPQANDYIQIITSILEMIKADSKAMEKVLGETAFNFFSKVRIESTIESTAPEWKSAGCKCLACQLARASKSPQSSAENIFENKISEALAKLKEFQKGMQDFPLKSDTHVSPDGDIKSGTKKEDRINAVEITHLNLKGSIARLLDLVTPTGPISTVHLTIDNIYKQLQELRDHACAQV